MMNYNCGLKCFGGFANSCLSDIQDIPRYSRVEPGFISCDVPNVVYSDAKPMFS